SLRQGRKSRAAMPASASAKRTLRKVRELHNLSRRHSLQPCTSISHSRNPHCTQAAQHCRLWAARELPQGRRRTDLPFTSVAGRRQAPNPQGPATLFVPLQSASHLRPCDACGHAHAVPGRALGKEGIMHATLSPSWKKSLLLVFVAGVAFVTATPATSGPQCFFQGLGFLPGDNRSSARGVNANGTVVVGTSFGVSGGQFVAGGQAFRWVNGTMTGLGFL